MGILRFVPSSRARLLLGVLVLALVIGVPLAYAAHQFTDVSDGNPFHGDISAIALAGITSGKTCTVPGTPPTYCPTENVTREAMAAFMHRGFGRVANGYFPVADLPAGSGFVTPSGWTLNITPGLAPTAIAGASGFVKADASVNICNNRTDFIYQVGAELRINGSQTATYFAATDVLPNGGCSVVSLTGAASVGTSLPQAVSVRVAGGSGVGGEIVADAVITATYFPFGSTGTNALGATSALSTSAAAKKLTHLGPRKTP